MLSCFVNAARRRGGVVRGERMAERARRRRVGGVRRLTFLGGEGGVRGVVVVVVVVGGGGGCRGVGDGKGEKAGERQRAERDW